ncbi:MAG: DJ-1/PfpI family protein [Lachnospiraceae bacterium]|nr:DJ-1/PfpI family protein [Lachnospiraceae bacterium]
MIYVFLAEGFEEIEALTPVDLLRRAGIDVKTVSIDPKESTVTGARGIGVLADTVISGITVEKDDIIVLPGGMPGTLNLLGCDMLMKILDDHNAEGGRIAAICAAPARILGARGLLKGKKATCYPGLESHMDGATPVIETVVTDENITTSRGLGTAVDFACELITLISGKEKSDEIRSSVVA